MPTIDQTLAGHEAALSKQNPDKISAHYATNAILIVNGATYRGPKEIAQFYKELINDLPGARWRTDVAVIHEDIAYIEWACESAGSSVKFGTDTFVVKDGQITRQTASFSIDVDASRDTLLTNS